jgi:hypothetical protein
MIMFAPLASSQGASEGRPLTLPAGKDSVVRFYYQPANGEYFHVALIFRVVERNDLRWNTAPLFDVGRTAYVSLSDMQQLMTNLTHLSLRWDEREKIESLETFSNLNSYGKMGIKVLSANGTAKTRIESAKLCEMLAPLDGAFLTPRALWEFQLFRLQYHCQIPKFNPKAYPERD